MVQVRNVKIALSRRDIKNPRGQEIGKENESKNAKQEENKREIGLQKEI